MKIAELVTNAEAAEQFLKALANKHRLLVLCALHDAERSVGELQARVDLSQSALSQHLARLREDGLVVTRRSSQTIYYALADESVTKMIALLHELFCVPKKRRKRGSAK
ncbi:MAG: metalloregulator ArsR/SmtB family transcription factor [Hyphomicrobiaceae bacterium]